MVLKILSFGLGSEKALVQKKWQLLLLHPFNGFFQDNLGKPTPER